jgi:hypothetical protein
MTQELIKAISIEEIKAAVPSKKNAITSEIVELINRSQEEPEFQGESLLSTMTTYESVMAGRSGVGIKDYINAVRFCAYLMTVDDNYTEAYCKTFRERDFVKERLGSSTDTVEYRELTKAASRYRASKLVVDILTISQVPLDLMFTGARYRAVGVLATLMETAKYDKDRISAAKELLAATKGPEKLQVQLGVGAGESSAIDRLNDQLAMIAARQMGMLESGAVSLQELGAIKVIHDDLVSEQ